MLPWYLENLGRRPGASTAYRSKNEKSTLYFVPPEYSSTKGISKISVVGASTAYRRYRVPGTTVSWWVPWYLGNLGRRRTCSISDAHGQHGEDDVVAHQRVALRIQPNSAVQARKGEANAP
eukprot:1312363-Rhodomonas_salina.1